MSAPPSLATAAGSPLASFPPLLRREPALVQVVGRTNATLAVPAAAQSFVVAGLAHLSERTPLLVVTPTLVDAERTAEDLACFLGAPAEPVAFGEPAGPVALFAPWETLPFERVSPEVATMGHRLALLWHLFGDPAETGSAVRVVVAPVRAVLQHLGPWTEAAPPLVVAKGETLDATELVERLVAVGYRREHQVEHRGELAVRGGIIDVFPSTASGPVRIDLFGDEVDRLASFDVADQRSVADLETVAIYGCRELVATPEVRRVAAGLIDARAVGALPMGAPGRRPVLRRHGGVAALAARRRAAGDGPVAGGVPGGARRAPPGARPGGRALRRGGRAAPARCPAPGGTGATPRPSRACTPTSTGSSSAARPLCSRCRRWPTGPTCRPSRCAASRP